MKLFLAGWKTNFKLTDKNGRPTEALRVMVSGMRGELCQADGLAPEEKRNFTHHKGVVEPVFTDRWFIRDISNRLRNDCHWWSGYPGGIYWNMFKTDEHLGLLHKDRVTQFILGEKVRTHLFLVACPPDWELSDSVYCGLYRWHGHHVRRPAWDPYPYLAEMRQREAQTRKVVARPHGHPAVVSA